jgi:hypothetical protein
MMGQQTKEHCTMENSFDRPDYLNGSAFPFQEIEGGFDEWVGWLRSVKLTRSESPVTGPFERGIIPQKESTDKEYKPGRQWDGDRESEAVRKPQC